MKRVNILLQALTVCQLKAVRVLIDKAMEENNFSLTKHEQDRNESLKEIGNLLHETCIVSNNEVCSKMACINNNYIIVKLETVP